MQSLDFYLKKVKEANLRLTTQRIEVIKCLLKHNNWHTIDDIIDHLTIANNKKPNIASVYNVLHSLVSCKIINAFLDVNSFKPFFNLRHDEHEHVYCFTNKKQSFFTIPFEKKLVNQIKKYFINNGFETSDFYIVANGLVKSNEKKCK
ncbi:transcriptional repressor [Mycoplasmoides pirum]|uniref:transcriptional repressor n=1 Tax=Mycoplasmoides pirum TaxID=2122 RepID=UPI000481DF3A|nr:transcriptional repressor [Mycoplasmoides pirum]